MKVASHPPNLLIAHGAILLGTPWKATSKTPETAYQFSYGIATAQPEHDNHRKANVGGA